MSPYVYILAFCLFVIQTNGQYEGDYCFIRGFQGVCTNIRKCQSAIDNIRYGRGSPPWICSFSATDLVVCCLDVISMTIRIVPVHTTKRITTTTEDISEDISEEEDYELNEGNSRSNDQCEPILANMTAPKTGQKAWDKCVEYQHKLIFPCERMGNPNSALHRVIRCPSMVRPYVLGGSGATSNEFPHMVLLGYGGTFSNLQWACGGSLISERFILTAGHCTSGRDIGPVTHARVGALCRTDPLSPSQLYVISDIIKHPDYHSPNQYNDIALLKTDRDVILDEFTVPACLDVGTSSDYSYVIATGWGVTQYKGNLANCLQKVIIKKFTTAECSEMLYSSRTRTLKEGFDVNTQICYGDKDKSKDTCQGDSGGPIQVPSQHLFCMYTVVGLTSFGNQCGIGKPGVYTRVAAFIPWIESVVWP